MQAARFFASFLLGLLGASFLLGCEAQANGPCEDGVAKYCPEKTGASCIACAKNHTELKKVCNNFPHDAVQACGQSPSPGPSPGPSPRPSPPEPASCPYLISKNSYSYVCSPKTVASAATEDIACLQLPDPRTGDTGTLKCPDGKTILCFVYASYGNVAGSCDECSKKQKCGTCQDCVWKDRCSYSAGGCFGNCVDCFGEVCDPHSPKGPGCAAYFPSEWGSSCVGKNSCYMAMKGSGQSASWKNSSGQLISVKSTGGSGCPTVDKNGKFKALAVCGSSAVDEVFA